MREVLLMFPGAIDIAVDMDAPLEEQVPAWLLSEAREMVAGLRREEEVLQ
jgi:hypothetical protein